MVNWEGGIESLLPRMTLRSHQTYWFEVFVRREQVIYALEALADTQSVQLELDSRVAESLNIKELVQGIRACDELTESHRDFLPDSAHKPTRFTGPPDDLVHQMRQQLQQWCDRLAPLPGEISRLKAQRVLLQSLEQAAVAMGDSSSQLPQLGHATELMFKQLYRCPTNRIKSAVFDGLLEQSFPGEKHCFVVIACLPEQRQHVTRLLDRNGCEALSIPPDLTEQPGQQLADIRRRLETTEADIGKLEGQVEALRNDAEIAEVLANLETLRWFTGAAHQVGARDASMCHITGWTSEDDVGRLKRVLEKAHVEAEVRFATPPAGTREPVARQSGWWRQPFQIFTVLSGAPSTDEIDPTGLLTIVVPLLFGYMFPDTGHGLVIAVAGLVLSRYTLRARILVSCGLAGALMGVLFDDFFGYRMLEQPWQFQALEDPLLVLVIPIYFGVGLLLLGLIFNGIELHWRGELKRWLLSDAAVLLLYISILLSLFHEQFLLGVAVALLWYLLGAIVMGGRKWARQLAVSIGELAHSTLKLILNTISFVRVGAFALAHIGLTQVVVTLSESVETRFWSIVLLVIGHTMIIVLEGLVVFIQVTRLVLFEFFLQFLRSEGRFLQPLSPSKFPPGH